MDVNISHLRSFYTAAKMGRVLNPVERLMVNESLLASHVKLLE